MLSGFRLCLVAQSFPILFCFLTFFAALSGCSFTGVSCVFCSIHLVFVHSVDLPGFLCCFTSAYHASCTIICRCCLLILCLCFACLQVTLCKRCVFSITDRHDGLYLVLTVERVLQGDNDANNDPYQKEKQVSVVHPISP